MSEFDIDKIVTEAHTKTLMRWRKRALESGVGEYWYDDAGKCVIPHAVIIAELNTREHVPNKSEAKLLRQQKAKQQRSR